MATIKRFEDIDAWKDARILCDKVGKIIDQDRLNKNFRLLNQIEGSSGSIMDNIAEGFERGTRAEFIQFLGYSKASCGEFRSQLYRMLDRKYIVQEEFLELFILAENISKRIQKFIEYLQSSTIKGVRKKEPSTLDIKP